MQNFFPEIYYRLPYTHIKSVSHGAKLPRSISNVIGFATRCEKNSHTRVSLERDGMFHFIWMIKLSRIETKRTLVITPPDLNPFAHLSRRRKVRNMCSIQEASTNVIKIFHGFCRTTLGEMSKWCENYFLLEFRRRGAAFLLDCHQKIKNGNGQNKE